MSTAAHIFDVSYLEKTAVVAGENRSELRLALEGGRGAVGLSGEVVDRELFRDAMLTLLALRESDLRYRGRDRVEYLAYLMKKGKRASAAIWEAQKAWLDTAFADEKKGETALDAVLTVDPDELSLEAFSRDESAYARLAFDSSLFAGRAASHGTRLVSCPPELVGELERLRSYQPLRLEAHTEWASSERGHTSRLELSTGALRGFLQVQAAAGLPHTSLSLARIDVYNLLFLLRTRKAKKPPRGIRFELVPGQPPRVVVEPWDVVLEGHGAPYEGKSARIVRVFGRSRLSLVARLLPHLRGAHVHLVGPGLPAFWTFELGRDRTVARLVIGLTGWSESSWASATSFDALMNPKGGAALVDRALGVLGKRGPSSLTEVASELSVPAVDVRSALQRGSLRGLVLYDLATERYRPRSLFAAPVDESQIRYGSEREAKVHRLLGDAGAKGSGKIAITKVHRIVGEGTEVHGQVEDKETLRSFSPRFTVNDEGQVSDAWCSCLQFQRSGMREGPCEHMLALRIVHGREEEDREKLRGTKEGRARIHAETRTLVRRDARGEELVHRVSLDGRVVRIVWGPRSVSPGAPGSASRNQHLWFDSDKEAKDAYFARLDRLASEGFVDTEERTA